MLFSQERVRLRITKSKMALTFQGYSANFRRKGRTKNHPVKTIVKGQRGHSAIIPRKSKTKNHQVKNSVTSTHGTMLLSQEEKRLQIIQSKLALTVLRVQCCIPRKE